MARAPFGRAVAVGIATLLFGTGIGHAAMGNRIRAVVWLAAVFAVLASSCITVWMLPVALIVHVAGAIDTAVYAYRKHAIVEWVSPWTGGVVVAMIVFAILLRAFVVEAFKTPASSMHPTIEIGDHVFISKLGSVERGDIVVFKFPCDPTRDYMKRVVAMAGDTVEIRCDGLYINGKAAPNRLIAAQASYEDRSDDGAWYTRSVSRYRETLGGHTYDLFNSPERPSAGAIANERTDFPIDQEPGCDHGPQTARGKLVETKSGAGACEPHLHYVVPAGHVFVLGDNRNNSNDSRFWGSVPAAYVKGRVIGIWYSSGRGGGFDRFGEVE